MDNEVKNREGFGALLREILNLDIKPALYRVLVIANDYDTRFDAELQFRGDGGSVTVDAETPEQALKNLKDLLLKQHGKCPHCGQYMGGQE